MCCGVCRTGIGVDGTAAKGSVWATVLQQVHEQHAYPFSVMRGRASVTVDVLVAPPNS